MRIQKQRAAEVFKPLPCPKELTTREQRREWFKRRNAYLAEKYQVRILTDTWDWPPAEVTTGTIVLDGQIANWYVDTDFPVSLFINDSRDWVFRLDSSDIHEAVFCLRVKRNPPDWVQEIIARNCTGTIP